MAIVTLCKSDGPGTLLLSSALPDKIPLPRGAQEAAFADRTVRNKKDEETRAMSFFNKDTRLTVGFGGALNSGQPSDNLSPAERKLLEQVAERIIAEYSETLKKLGDE